MKRDDAYFRRTQSQLPHLVISTPVTDDESRRPKRIQEETIRRDTNWRENI
jgi:hypothetical protein